MGYSIGLQDGLLDDKHRLAMGGSLWVYAWLIKRQTKNNGKVLGGRPMRYADICISYPSMSERAYLKHLATLRDTGYIETVRAPHGLVITIVKPKKWQTDTPNTADHKAKSDMQEPAHQSGSDMHKSVVSSAQKRRSNIRVRKSNNRPLSNTKAGVDDLKVVEMPDLDQPVDALTSNELKPKSLRRDRPDINGVVFAFEKAMGVKLKRVATQRNMAKHLINHYGVDAVLQGIKAVALVRDERYAPQILDLQDLWEKWDKLGAYFRRKRSDQEGKVAVIESD